MNFILFTFEYRVPSMRKGASMVWHLSLQLVNSITKTEADIFPMHAMLPSDFQSFLILMLVCVWGEENQQC